MADSEQGKLFVGGISRDTDEVVLTEHFSRYGNLSSSIVARDHNSGTPRGFGFVTFSDPSSADKALSDNHEISGRKVDVKRAIPKTEQQQNHQSLRENESGCGGVGSNVADVDNQYRTKKIFVGGLSTSLTQEEFRSYFQKFGRITDVVVMHDNATNRPRGFGFITFESEDVVDRIVQNRFYELGGKSVEVKKAIPKDTTSGNYSRKSIHGVGVCGGGSHYDGYWLGNQWPGGVRYDFLQAPPGYFRNGYGFCGPMFPMTIGGYGPVRYCTLPVIAAPGGWNGMGLPGYVPNVSAGPFFNSNAGAGAAFNRSPGLGLTYKDQEGTKQ